MRKIKILIVFIFVFISSCRPSNPIPPSCESLLGNTIGENINTDIKITEIYSEKIFDDLYDMVIVVDNHSKSVLRLSPNADIKVYLLEDSVWVQQVNIIEYPLDEDQIGVKSSTDPGGKIYSFSYDPAVLYKAKSICVTLTAIKKSEILSDKVDSYFEISLEK